MVLWRGRLVFRQYIKNKRHRYGVKLYLLTEPDGTMLKASVYTGTLDGYGGKGHAANIVLHLTEEMLDVGHSLFIWTIITIVMNLLANYCSKNLLYRNSES